LGGVPGIHVQRLEPSLSVLPSAAITVASALIFAGAEPVAISIISCVVFSLVSLLQPVNKMAVAVDIRYIVLIMYFLPPRF